MTGSEDEEKGFVKEVRHTLSVDADVGGALRSWELWAGLTLLVVAVAIATEFAGLWTFPTIVWGVREVVFVGFGLVGFVVFGVASYVAFDYFVRVDYVFLEELDKHGNSQRGKAISKDSWKQWTVVQKDDVNIEFDLPSRNLPNGSTLFFCEEYDDKAKTCVPAADVQNVDHGMVYASHESRIAEQEFMREGYSSWIRLRDILPAIREVIEGETTVEQAITLEQTAEHGGIPEEMLGKALKTHDAQTRSDKDKSISQVFDELGIDTDGDTSGDDDE